MWRVVIGWVVLSLGAQCGVAQDLAPGDVLVASERLADPNFARSVILVVQYDSQEGTVGLILNRPSEIPLSKVFPDVRHASRDPVYLGGPVETTAAAALLRLPQKANEAISVLADIYITGARNLIEKSVASRTDPSKFRIYLGYAGWAAGQLEAEIQAGAWSVLHRRPSVVFDANPDSLWLRLDRESHSQMAENAAPPALEYLSAAW